MFRRLTTFALPAIFALANGLAVALTIGLAPLPAQAAAEANKATQAELESVKGIGPRLSGRILEARQAAPFKNWSDLIERVPGVGPGNAQRYSEAGLTVAGAAFDASALPPAAPAASKAARAERRSEGEVKPTRAPRTSGGMKAETAVK